MNKILLIIYTLVILLLPSTMNIASITYPKVIMVLTIILLLYNLLKDRAKIKDLFNNKIIKSLIISILTFTAIIAVSTLYNTIKFKAFYITDYFEVLRPVLYLGIFINYAYFLKDEKNKTIVLNLISICLIIHSVFAITQYFNFFNMNELYIKQLAPTQYRALGSNYPTPRSVGLTGNPNVFGFLMALGTLITIYKIFKNPKKIFYYFEFLFYNIVLFTASSRTSYICCFIMNLIFIIFYNRKLIKRMFLLVAIYMIFMSVLLFLLPNSLTWRIKQLVNISTLTSWQQRVTKNENAVQDIKETISNEDKETNVESNKVAINNNSNVNSVVNATNKNNQINTNNTTDVTNIIKSNTANNQVIENNQTSQETDKSLNLIIGNGVMNLKKIYNKQFDNEWLLLIFQYGIIGLIGYLFMLIFPMIYSKKATVASKSLYIAILIGIFIYMIPAAIYHSYFLSFMTVIILSLAITEIEYNK